MILASSVFIWLTLAAMHALAVVCRAVQSIGRWEIKNGVPVNQRLRDRELGV